VSVALESRPRARRHIGSVLQVVGARYLEPDEVEAIDRYVGRSE
jgi:hypothetical protein